MIAIMILAMKLILMSLDIFKNGSSFIMHTHMNKEEFTSIFDLPMEPNSNIKWII